MVHLLKSPIFGGYIEYVYCDDEEYQFTALQFAQNFVTSIEDVTNAMMVDAVEMVRELNKAVFSEDTPPKSTTTDKGKGALTWANDALAQAKNTLWEVAHGPLIIASEVPIDRVNIDSSDNFSDDEVDDPTNVQPDVAGASTSDASTSCAPVSDYIEVISDDDGRDGTTPFYPGLEIPSLLLGPTWLMGLPLYFHEPLQPPNASLESPYLMCPTILRFTRGPFFIAT